MTTPLTAAQMRDTWALVDHENEKVKAVDASWGTSGPRLSCRWRDGQQPGGERLYDQARVSLHAGYDCLLAVQMLVDAQAGALATLSLTRTVLEAAFWVEWLLEPDRSRDRLLRGLRVAVDDHKQWKAFSDEHTKQDTPAAARIRALIDQTSDQQISAFKREAIQLGIPWAEVTASIKVTNELRGLGCARERDADGLVGVWRGLSGLQHGKVYATNYFAADDVVDEATFRANAMAATWLLLRAFDTYLRRSRS
jgi:hypothetical protein